MLGILLALAGDPTSADAGPAGPVGIVLGALACLLGARGLGIAAMVLSVVEVLLGSAG